MGTVFVPFHVLLGLELKLRQKTYPDRLLLSAPLRHSFQVPEKPEIATTAPEDFVQEFRQSLDLLPNRINIDAQSVEQGLAKLVLTLIEFIRRLLEAQALRRMEGSDLSPQQIEELGLALMKLESRMKNLKSEFKLSDEDLNLNLGPIGRLI